MIGKLLNKEEKLSVIGLGYVGMPLAVTFAEKGISVIGFDLNKEKINKYLNGEDPTNEIGSERLKKLTTIEFTSNETKIREAKFHIVAVPTPVGKHNIPDLYPVESASRVVGRNLIKGSYVVFESTVYPGVTEDICVPILEKESGLKCGIDFKVGYSPERINPGDKVHTLENITKITSGMDEESSEVIAQVYENIIKAGVHRASSIKVAEAAKVIENSQRDVNIAFVNELAMIFDKMNIDTQEVLEAAGTKWNFLPFRPGLVGGHCIGVDPYYLTYKSEEVGYKSKLISSGREINNEIPKFVVEKTVRMLIDNDIKVKNANVLVLGLTFKEDCPDLRNSKVVDIVEGLKSYGMNITIFDPVAEKEEAKREYGLEILNKLENIEKVDVIIGAVKHKEFKSLLIENLYKENQGKILLDLKGILNKKEVENKYKYWRM
ncbi:MAG: nucleotide sugar dehydrogenase [Fusobacterium mortiferum]|jgi:UDP-N-acetyl-D-galactosamine dehydrogenase|nr:nucleotide sugar dehydrogenase [uncultured Fusobacterium sp.]MDD7261120.1 nucleotide sugar dehydrogenase [Fusobacterium mortiferum]MDY5981177.1 nucleotide sugar dehydrogenase [Fusobacterium mortiferum]